MLILMEGRAPARPDGLVERELRARSSVRGSARRMADFRPKAVPIFMDANAPGEESKTHPCTPPAEGN